MDYEVMTKQQEKTAQRLQLRRIVSAVSILIGFSGIVLAAVLSTQQTTLSNNLPKYEPLQEGTYVPAQVVFKVKKGKSAEVALKNLLAKKQTLYQKKSDRTFLPMSEAKLAENNPAYEKKTITLHKKSLHKIFSEPEINSNTREKIFRRPGVSEPSKTYDELGLREWYVATVDEAYADIQQLSWHLESDSKNIEFAGANLYAETKVALENASSEPLNNSDSAVTTTACSNPNDPYSCSVGNVPVVPSDQWYLRAIQAEQAWQISAGNPDTIIAVVDTGVDTQHPDIKEKIWLNSSEDKNRNNCADYWGVQIIQTDCHGNMVLGDLDGVDDDLNGYKDDLNGMHFGWESIFPGVNYRLGPVDTNGHGTIDAGIIGAAQNTNTPIGISGVCPGCLIMPLQVNFDSVQVAKAWQYAVDNGATIINFSGQFDPREEETLYNLLHSAAYYVDRAGVTLVAASGNENIDFVDAGFFPGIEPTAINVGSSTVQGNRSWHNPNPCTTNTGSSSGSNWGNNLDLLAPGERILAPMGYNYSNTLHEPLCLLGTISCSEPTVYYSCDLVGIVANNPATKEGYMFSSGTSHAAPIVSGIAGLMRSVNKALTPYDIKGILQTTAERVESVIDENGLTIDFSGAWNPYAGYGLTNAQAAVQEAYNRRPDFGITITPGTTPIVAVDVNKIRYDIWVENRGWTTATGVPYKVVNADTNETVYSGVTPTLYGNAGGWLNETVTLSSSVPSRLKVIIDPENLYSEPFENDNSSPPLVVTAYGTPYINHQEKQEVTLGSSVVFQVSATDVNTPAEQLTYVASNLPLNASFANKTFTWTPDASLSSGTYYPVFGVSDPDGLQSALAVPIQYNNPSAATYANLQATTATFDEATVTWTTNTLSDSSIEYGLTTAYGERLYDSVLTKDHSLALRVEPGQTYHYKIVSCTAGVNRACVTSGDRVYQAPAIPVATLSNVHVTVNKDRWPYLLTTVWDTNIPTNGQMNWGIGNTDTRTVDDEVSTTHHETNVVVQPNTTYQVTVSGCTNQPLYYQRCSESPVTSVAVPAVASPPTPKVTINNNVAVIAWSCLEQPTAGTVQLFLNNQLIASQNYSGTNNSVSFPVQPSTSYTYHVKGTNSGYWCSDMAGLSFTSPSNNQPPIIPTLSSVTAYRGTLFSFQFPVATDPEGKALNYAVSGLPPGATYDIETRKITWLLGTNKTYLSSYAVQYIATDADGGSATATLKISVQTFSSFLPGTPIRLATGRLILVEDIRGGEVVRTYNPDTKRWGVGTINGVFTYVTKDYYVLNDAVRVTSKHPVLTARGWVQVQDLRFGDRVKTETGYAPILSQRKIQQAATVYNLEVSGDETYVAGGYVVHNKKNPYTQTGL